MPSYRDVYDRMTGYRRREFRDELERRGHRLDEYFYGRHDCADGIDDYSMRRAAEDAYNELQDEERRREEAEEERRQEEAENRRREQEAQERRWEEERQYEEYQEEQRREQEALEDQAREEAEAQTAGGTE